MAIIERYRSPDGLLELLVDLTTGDWSIGFEGVPSHTHGDILAAIRGGSPESAIRTYIDDVISSRSIIVIMRVDQKIRDAFVADGPTDDLMKHAFPNETMELRYWNGERISG